MKCPLCDGSVVNGRCTFCGMPYRKDEILYHLNESRSDHYKHATPKAKKIMTEQQKGKSAGSVRNTAVTAQKSQQRPNSSAGTRNTRTAASTRTPVQKKQKKGSGVLWIFKINPFISHYVVLYSDMQHQIWGMLKWGIR